MANEKMTAKKVLAIMVVSGVGSVALGLLYLGILIFSLPFTANMKFSWILSLSITSGIILFCLGYAVKRRQKRRTQN